MSYHGNFPGQYRETNTLKIISVHEKGKEDCTCRSDSYFPQTAYSFSTVSYWK